ncbi:MAG: hypothetical protein Q8O87_03120 [bacterium]|nr:hypothetical protein [bacterium]
MATKDKKKASNETPETIETIETTAAASRTKQPRPERALTGQALTELRIPASLAEKPVTPHAFSVVNKALTHQQLARFMGQMVDTATANVVEVVAGFEADTLSFEPDVRVGQEFYSETSGRLSTGEDNTAALSIGGEAHGGLQLTLAQVTPLLEEFREQLAQEREEKQAVYAFADDGDKTSCYLAADCGTKSFHPRSLNVVRWRNGEATIVNDETGKPRRIGSYRAVEVDGVLICVAFCPSCINAARKNHQLDSRFFTSEDVDALIKRRLAQANRQADRISGLENALGPRTDRNDRGTSGWKPRFKKQRGTHGGSVRR